MLTLLRHQWIRFQRSRRFGSTLFVKIIVGCAVALMLLQLAAASYLLPEVTPNIAPQSTPFELANQIIFYIFAFSLMGRFAMQRVSAPNVLPYFHLPLPKKQIRTLRPLLTTS